jgi:hypothetical protein
MPEFDQYLAIYIFSALKLQFQLQGNEVRVLMAQLYAFLSAEHS